MIMRRQGGGVSVKDKVNVIGGGIFGCTAAILAARMGYEVHLYEKRNTLLTGASSHNQWRLHRGYHYPRSPETGKECRLGIDAFTRFYPGVLQLPRVSCYAIAEEDSRTSPEAYLKFLSDSGLPSTKFRLGNPLRNVALSIEVQERLIEPWDLRRVILYKLNQHRVKVHLAHNGVVAMGDEPDVPTVVAVYDKTNLVLGTTNRYRFQLVEKPVVWLEDDRSRSLSVVILDGPFGCIDPYGNSGLHLVGHVTEAVHNEWTGQGYDLPPGLGEAYVNAYIHGNPPVTRWPEIQKALGKFVTPLNGAHHVGSMFTVRCVHAGVEETDERPTDVVKVRDNRVSIVSGKIPTCVIAAKKAWSLLGVGELPDSHDVFVERLAEGAQL